MKTFSAMAATAMLAAILGGCEMKTLPPNDFLFLYRSGSLPSEPSTARVGASYEGSDGTYHYVAKHSLTPSEAMLADPTSGGQKYRCRMDQLPADFPADFEPLSGGESIEPSSETREYIQNYLARHKTRTPIPVPQPPKEHDFSEP